MVDLTKRIVDGFILFLTFVILYFYVYLIFLHVWDWMKHKTKMRIKNRINQYVTSALAEGTFEARAFNRLIRSRYRKNVALEWILEWKEENPELAATTMEKMDRSSIRKYVVSQMHSRNLKNQIFGIKMAGDLGMLDVAPRIRGKINHPVIDMDLQYQGLLALAKLADLEGMREYLYNKSNHIQLTIRTLQEVFMAYVGDKVAFNQMLLGASDKYVRVCAIKIIGSERMEVLAPLIRENMNSSHAALKIACVKAMGQLDLKEYVGAVEDLLSNESWEVRSQAAKTLGLLKAESSLAVLEKALNDNEWWVRYNAAWSITQYDGLDSLVARVMGGKDKFAKDILSYTLQIEGKGEAYGLV